MLVKNYPMNFMFASAAANNGVPYVCFLPMSREILALAEVCAPRVLSSILKPLWPHTTLILFVC